MERGTSGNRAIFSYRTGYRPASFVRGLTISLPVPPDENAFW
jgi:hypothetical protein